MIWFVLGVGVGVFIMCCVQINRIDEEIEYWKNKYFDLLKERGDSNGKQRD